jgi:hypothetical protein
MRRIMSCFTSSVRETCACLRLPAYTIPQASLAAGPTRHSILYDGERSKSETNPTSRAWLMATLRSQTLGCGDLYFDHTLRAIPNVASLIMFW